MKLTLDHTQRLNLHALLGAQRADVGSIRAIWEILDKIALHAKEERATELHSGKGIRVHRRGGHPNEGRDRDLGAVWRGRGS